MITAKLYYTEVYTMKLALQIYTLRNSLTTPELIADTLSKVKAMGYDGVEWHGLLNMSPAELRKVTLDAGLEFFSVFVNQNIVDECDTALLDELAAAGVKYLTLGWLPEDRIAGGAHFELTCEKAAKYGAEANKRGMRFLYHNHDFDLAPFESSTKLDKLLEAVPSEVLGAELDTCWLYSGGVDAAEYLRKYSSRAPIIHLKDCVKEGGRSGYMPVGHGVLDWNAVLAECGNAEWLCVEQDQPCEGHDAFECAAMSAEYLRKNYCF